MESKTPSIYRLVIGDHAEHHVIYGHGWERDHHDFIPVAESLASLTTGHLLDFPGFGLSPRPQQTWDTCDYADAVAAEIRKQFTQPVIWVGHSFGGRVGLRLARQHPDLLRGMVLVGCAGIPRHRTVWAQWRGMYRKRLFKLRKAMAKSDNELAMLERQFGSVDYVRSQELGLRDIFLRTINEDQTADLPKISVPTSFIYGAEDNETPPEMGLRMATMMPQARCLVADEFDHISVLDRGRHLIAREIQSFLAIGA